MDEPRRRSEGGGRRRHSREGGHASPQLSGDQRVPKTLNKPKPASGAGNSVSVFPLLAVERRSRPRDSRAAALKAKPMVDAVPLQAEALDAAHGAPCSARHERARVSHRSLLAMVGVSP